MKTNLIIVKSSILLLFVSLITQPMFYRPQTPRITAQKIHEIVEARIASGKDLNLPINEIHDENNIHYPSPLIVCCENPPYVRTIELLLNKKANPNILGASSPISLICSSFSSHAHLLALRLLIDAQSYVDEYPFEAVKCLCEKPQDRAILKNPELRIEAIDLLLNANAHIPYKDVLIALLKTTNPEIPANESQILLQERKQLISRLLRTNVSIINKANPDFFDIDLEEKDHRLNRELAEYIRNHKTKRCNLNKSRCSLLLQLELAQKKNPLSPFSLIPKDVIRQIVLLVYPTMSGRS